MRVRTLISLILMLLASAGTSCAQMAIEWQHSLGGSDIDCSYSVQQTLDGGYIVLGHSGSTDGDVTGNHGDLDYWVTKLDKQGRLLWQHSYGGSSKDEAYSIQLTRDGGYILAGFSQSDDGDVTGHHVTTDYYDYWLVKIDAQGDLQWQHSLGGSETDMAYSVCQTPDDGFAIVGFSTSTDGDVTGSHGGGDVWVAKVDRSGTLLWQHAFGGSGEDAAYCIRNTNDGGLIVAGATTSTDGDVKSSASRLGPGLNAWLLKLDASGDLQWERAYGGTSYDFFYSVDQTTDGGYVVAGSSMSVDGDLAGRTKNLDSYDFWVERLTATGDVIWSKSFGGSQEDVAYCVQETREGNFIVSGDSYSLDGDPTGVHPGSQSDGWVLLLDNSGNTLWEQAFGGSSLDEAYDIKQTTDGGFIFTGSDLSIDGDVVGHHDPEGVSDFWVVKLSPPKFSRLLGFGDIPSATVCSSTIDTVRLIIPRAGNYTVTAISTAGNDWAAFKPTSVLPLNITTTDSTSIALPVSFVPIATNGARMYQTQINVTLRDQASGRDTTLSTMLSANAVSGISAMASAQFTQSTVAAGERVAIALGVTFDTSSLTVPLSSLNIRRLTFVLTFNTNLLVVKNDNVIAAFASTVPGWSLDGAESSFDAKANRLTVSLAGTRALPDTTSKIAYIALEGVLSPYDSVSTLHIDSCRIFTSDEQEMLPPCVNLTTAADPSIALVLRCGDSTLRSLLRGEAFEPFRFTSVSPNPSTGAVTVRLSRAIGPVQLVIRDVLGRLVFTQDISRESAQGDLSLELHDLPSGPYIMTVTDPLASASTKLLLSR